METKEFGLGWNQFVGAVAGLVIVAGVLSGVWWLRERRRRERDERPPQSERLYTAEQIKPVVARLEERCRDLEFLAS